MPENISLRKRSREIFDEDFWSKSSVYDKGFWSQTKKMSPEVAEFWGIPGNIHPSVREFWQGPYVSHTLSSDSTVHTDKVYDQEFWNKNKEIYDQNFWSERIVYPFEKTTIDSVSDTVVRATTLNNDVKPEEIVESVVGEDIKNDAPQAKEAASVWLWKYVVPILWVSSIATISYLAIFFYYSWALGVSWELLLSILSYLGLGSLPLTIFGSENLYVMQLFGTIMGEVFETPISIIQSTVVSTGIKLRTDLTIDGALALAQKNEQVRRVFQAQVPTKYLQGILKILGVKDPDKITVEQITRLVTQESLNALITIPTGGINKYLIAQGMKYGTPVASYSYNYLVGGRSHHSNIPPEKMAEEIVKASQKVNTEVVRTLFEGGDVYKKTVEEVDKQEVKFRESVESEETVTPSVFTKGVTRTSPKGKEPLYKKKKKRVIEGTPITRTSRTPVKHQLSTPGVTTSTSRINPPPPPATEESSKVKDAISNNKLAVVATFTAVSLVTVALAGYADDVAEIFKDQMINFGSAAASTTTGLAVKAAGWTVKSSAARQQVASLLLDKVGIVGVLNAFADKLTHYQKIELRTLADAIQNEKDVSLRKKYIDMFLGIISGGYILPSKLKNLTHSELLRKYRQLFPLDKNYQTKSSSELTDAIYQEQKERMERMNAIVAGAVRKIMVVSASKMVDEIAKTTWENMTDRLAEMEREGENVRRFLYTRSSIAREDAAKFKEELENQNKLEEELQKAAEEESKRLVAELGISESSEARGLIKEAARAAARELADAGRELKAARKALEDAARSLAAETARDKAEEIRNQNDLANASFQENLARTADVIIVNPDGISHPLPPPEVLMPKVLRDVTNYEFTPMVQYLTKQGIAYSTSWAPGVGWVQSYIQTANLGLTVAETTKDVTRIVQAVVHVQQGGNPEFMDSVLNNEALGKILKTRIPNIVDIVDKIVHTDRLNARDVILQALKDQIIEGWDTKRLAWEIGKKFIFGTGENFGVKQDITGDDVGIDVQADVGRMIFEAVTKSEQPT